MLGIAERETLLAKVRKCMALSKSSQPGEAAAALRMAQGIMAKHNITGAEVEASEVDSCPVELGEKRRSARFYSWANALVGIVSDAFGSTAVLNGRSNEVTFYGLNGAGEISAYTFTVIYRKVNRNRRLFMDQLPKEMSRSKRILRSDAYATGWVYGAGENVTPREIRDEEEKKVRAKIDLEMGAVETMKHKPSKEVLGCESALHYGYKEGKQFQLRQGVGGMASVLSLAGKESE